MKGKRFTRIVSFILCIVMIVLNVTPIIVSADTSWDGDGSSTADTSTTATGGFSLPSGTASGSMGGVKLTVYTYASSTSGAMSGHSIYVYNNSYWQNAKRKGGSGSTKSSVEYSVDGNFSGSLPTTDLSSSMYTWINNNKKRIITNCGATVTDASGYHIVIEPMYKASLNKTAYLGTIKDFAEFQAGYYGSGDAYANSYADGTYGYIIVYLTSKFPMELYTTSSYTFGGKTYTGVATSNITSNGLKFGTRDHNTANQVISHTGGMGVFSSIPKAIPHNSHFRRYQGRSALV